MEADYSILPENMNIDDIKYYSKRDDFATISLVAETETEVKKYEKKRSCSLTNAIKSLFVCL